ncbi:MAG: hypothetical protein ABUL62_24165 [Myxococcales bacterium]
MNGWLQNLRGLLRIFLHGSIVSVGALPRVAQAADGPEANVVVIVYESHATTVSRRLRQEIEALGFLVELKRETSEPRSLESLAMASGAVAAIRVQPLAEGGVEMTVLDRATGKTVHRDLLRVAAGDPAGEELIATRTVELLRASLLELNADHPSRGDAPVSAPVVAIAVHDQERGLRRRSGAVFVGAGPALLLMPGFSASAQLSLRGAWQSTTGFGLSAELFSPLSAARFSEPEGNVEARATCYRLGALWGLGSNDAPLSGAVGAGWSLSTLSARGSASAPYVGAQDDFVVWGPWLSLGARLRIADHLALWAQGSGSLALPRATLRVAERGTADFARPAWLLSLGPELSWP